MKVLAFDSWTAGVPHVTRLVEAFRVRQLDLLLIHIGSWGHDARRPNEEHFGPLLTRDVRYYGDATFDDILQREQPAGVLFLSMQSFAHRAFKRYCTSRGIPTIHLYHGVVGVQDITSRRLNPVSVRRQAALSLERAGKNLRQLLPTYARSLLATHASFNDWRWFALDLMRKVIGTSYSGAAAPDASTDICCVYVDADIAHAMQRYHMRRESVFVVGNPDLTTMGISQSDLACCLRRTFDSKQIVYIDTALVDVGAVFADEGAFVQHLIDTRDGLSDAGLELIVKLHPAHLRTAVPQRLRDAGIRLVDNQDFVSTLRRSCAAIVEPSSAALIPALLGLPVFLAKYGRLMGQAYGEVLTSYPRAAVLHELGDLPGALQAATSAACDGVDAWIAANAGPLPAEQMPDRVADACAALLARHGESR
jgi:hypothetical protein